MERIGPNIIPLKNCGLQKIICMFYYIFILFFHNIFLNIFKLIVDDYWNLC